jgi:hypothetical protein
MKNINHLRQKTTLPIHNSLNKHSSLYHIWHKCPHHKHFHWGFLTFFIAKLVLTGWAFSYSNSDILAANPNNEQGPPPRAQNSDSTPPPSPTPESSPEEFLPASASSAPSSSPPAGPPGSPPSSQPSEPPAGPPESLPTPQPQGSGIKLSQKNSQGDLKSGNFEFFDASQNMVFGGQDGSFLPPGLSKFKKMRFKPLSGAFASIEFDDVEITSASEINIALDEKSNPGDAKKLYAVGNMEGFNFSKGRFTTLAQGKDLFKCVDWDFAGQSCKGKWRKAQDLTVGADYTVEFTPIDPGYKETSKAVNLLDKNKDLLNSTETVFEDSNNLSRARVEIVPDSSEASAKDIKKIKIDNLNTESASNDLVVSTVEDTVATGTVIDTKDLAAEKVDVEKKFNKKHVLACSQYDSASNSCGTWKKETDITAESTYTFSLPPNSQKVVGESKNNILVLNKDLDVIKSVQEEHLLEGEGNLSKVSIQLTDLNPHKIIAYYDSSIPQQKEITLNVEETKVNEVPGQLTSVSLGQIEATRAEIEGISEGYDLFHCDDLDFATQACRSKWRKIADLLAGESYSINIAKDQNYIKGLFESKKKISILGKENILLDYDETSVDRGDGSSDLEIRPKDVPVEKVSIKGHKASYLNEFRIDKIDLSKIEPPHEVSQGYAIDPTRLEAEETKIEAVAKGNSLYKCKEWNFDAGTCSGSWVKVMALNPGQAYTLAIDNKDPGFIEVDENTSPPPAPISVVTTGGGGGSGGSWSSSPAVILPEVNVTKISTESNEVSMEEQVSTEETEAVASESQTENPVSRVVEADLENTNKDASAKQLMAVVQTAKILKRGSVGSEIMELQRFLNSQGFTLAEEGDYGAPGNETEYFGPRTKAALIRFQEAHADEILLPYGLTKGTGILGPKTKAVIERILSTENLN